MEDSVVRGRKDTERSNSKHEGYRKREDISREETDREEGQYACTKE